MVTESHDTVVNSVLGEIENAYKPRDFILSHLEIPVVLLVGQMYLGSHLRSIH